MKRLFVFLYAGLFALVMTSTLMAGEPQAKQEPAHPDDLEVNRAFKESIQAFGGDEKNNDGIHEPMLSKILGQELKLPHSKQVIAGEQVNLLTNSPSDAIGAISATGHEIHSTRSPHRDLFAASLRVNNSARAGFLDQEAATEILDVLLGRTKGRIYDGFPLLNFNRFNSDDVPAEAFTPGTLAGEYKTKQIRYTGEQEPSWKNDGTMVNIWEIDVNHLWYDQQFDSDTFLFKIPYEDSETGIKPGPDDTLRINYSIYSLVEEDFAPTQVTLDAQVEVDYPDRGSVRFPYKGQDTVWVRVNPETVHRMTVQHTALRFLRGVYIWGWNVHPPRIQFLQPVVEIKNLQTGNIEMDPEGQSYTLRNRALSIDNIGDAAPEKKLYTLAKGILNGNLTAEQVSAYLNQADEGPNGTWMEWLATMTDQRTLPSEVRQILASEGKTINDYDFITVYMNNELYGKGPLGHTIRNWSQGETMQVRLFNLDNHTHYFRNVGFGPSLHNDLTENTDDGVFSFEIMNFKPLYGAPKVAEMQWRAGWGFRPHYSSVQQDDVFSRESDQRMLQPYLAPNLDDGRMDVFYGYQFSEEARGGDFPFNPPKFIIATTGEPAHDGLYDLTKFEDRIWGGLLFRIATGNWSRWRDALPDDSFDSGLVIGQTTEGWGLARFCEDAPPGFCPEDLSAFHWRGKKNWPAPNDPSVPKTELRFPPFLRNPNQVAGGDIIPPTWVWRPFLWISPKNGTIYNDPDDPSKGYWADHTYAHGRPIQAGGDQILSIEMPRSAGQLFYQFDDLFHDNAIFSPHPIR